jgi:hypothetical protein
MHVAKNIEANDWRTVHASIERLAVEQRGLDVEIGRCLSLASRLGVHRRLGISTFVEYADRMFGFDARMTRERLRVADALEALPSMRAALQTGRCVWSAVRELTRVATAETEAAWLEVSEGMTVRQIESEVSGRKKGDAPSAAKDPLLTSRRVVFELMPEDFALIMEAFEHVRQEIGPSASNAFALRAMAETVLGKRPERDARYRVTLTVCAECGQTSQRAGGEMIEVPPEVGECAECDGKVVAFTGGEAEMTPVGRESEVVTEIRAAPEGGARALLRAATRAFGRGRMDVTPALREAVLGRDQHRCVVPGCRCFRMIDVHHLKRRADGGAHALDNIILVCDVHHRLLHAGLLAIETANDGRVIVRGARGTRIGMRRDPRGA